MKSILVGLGSLTFLELGSNHGSFFDNTFALQDQPLSPIFSQMSPYWNSLVVPEDDILDPQTGASTMSFLEESSVLTQILTADRTILLRSLPWAQFQELIEPTGS
jgi:hypothetical protein